MKATKELTEFVHDLCQQATQVRGSLRVDGSGYRCVDGGKLNGLIAGCRLLVTKLGAFGKVWDEMLQPPESNFYSESEKVSAVLDAIADALAKGRLATVEEIVSAEVLGDLLEHAEELLRAKYNLAAAIVLRAVIEERLRKLCESNGCFPTKQRPSIEDFKQSLYATQRIDKIVVKDIDWMAGVGNSAAHHLPEFHPDDVPQLYQRVVAFLTKFSLT